MMVSSPFFRIAFLLSVCSASAFVLRPQQTLVRRSPGVIDVDPNAHQDLLSSSNISSSTTRLDSLPRRDFFSAAAAGGTLLSQQQAANAKTTTTAPGLIADLPMVRLKLPRGGFGREYVCVKIRIQGQGPYDFMVDTGLTTEFITPHLQQTLGISPNSKSSIQGFGAGGGVGSSTLVELIGASLCCGDLVGGANELPLPTLHAVITDFPQEHIDPKHDPVEGMLGMEFLTLFDVDFDFPKGRLRLWKPGTAAKAVSGMVEIPAVVINETQLIGIRVATSKSPQPILGFLDCGSSFSAVNWLAASTLGFPPRDDPSYRKGPSVAALGIDGRPLTLPTTKQQLTFAGKAVADPRAGRPVGFDSPPPSWKPWQPTLLAVGDLPVFPSILGDGVTPYQGPAALIGLDILAQRRVILETGGSKTRERRVFVSSS